MDIDNKLGFRENAIKLVQEYSNVVNKEHIDLKDVYVVWECKTLQNNKALLSTNVTDGRYYEVTYNGDKKEFYFDSYVREKNKCFREG